MKLFRSNLFRGKFILPITGEDEFNLWTELAEDFKIYLRVSALAVVMMCLRNLRVLTVWFPAFGVLFDTIRKAQRDLMYFFFVSNLSLSNWNSL